MGETTQEFLSVLENVLSTSDRRTAWVHLDTVVHRWVTEMANAGAQCPCRSVTAKTDVSDAVESRHSTEDPPAVACPLNDYQQDTIGSILSDIKQTAVYCDEVPVAYRTSSFHNRVVMMTEYRLVVLPTGRPRLGKRAPIVSASILQITSVDVNDNTVSVELGNGSILNVRQPERAESQFLTCLIERLQGVRRSWPDEERARLPSGCRYPDPSAADRDDVVGTYGAICDRDGIQGRSRFVDYLDRCRAQGDTTLNLRVRHPASCCCHIASLVVTIRRAGCTGRVSIRGGRAPAGAVGRLHIATVHGRPVRPDRRVQPGHRRSGRAGDRVDDDGRVARPAGEPVERALRIPGDGGPGQRSAPAGT